MPAVSVVIGFKDWGLDRLGTALDCLRQNNAPEDVELIVSDYGSVDGAAIERVAKEHTARYVRTETNGVWSRSRALNAGFAVASGDWFVSTDADMLFTPDALRKIKERLEDDPGSAFLIQCRDVDDGAALGYSGREDWRCLAAASKLRPRWGMGGMCAVSRAAYDTVRGFDERMEVWGAEDADFVLRLQRAGLRIRWIDDPGCRIYHMWHESSIEKAKRSLAETAAIERNRAILRTDSTTVRNLRWRHPTPTRRPVASVVIATFNRADYLAPSIASALDQTVDDIEVVIMDDGSTDSTPEVVAGFSDPRLKYVRQENQGVAAARNHALQFVRAPYVVVHDDDDLMLPWRIEAHMQALAPDVHGTYGGWIDFDQQTGRVQANNGKPFDVSRILYSGRVYAHATLMIRTDMLRALRYDESLLAGSDFDLATRFAAMGLDLRHTGEYHLLRRLHGQQLTSRVSGPQKAAARRALAGFHRTYTRADVDTLKQTAQRYVRERCRGEEDILAHVGGYIPVGRHQLNLRILVRSAAVRDLVTACLERSGCSFEELRLEPAGRGKPLFALMVGTRLQRAEEICADLGVPAERTSRVTSCDDPAALEAILPIAVVAFAPQITWRQAVFVVAVGARVANPQGGDCVERLDVSWGERELSVELFAVDSFPCGAALSRDMTARGCRAFILDRTAEETSSS